MPSAATATTHSATNNPITTITRYDRTKNYGDIRRPIPQSIAWETEIAMSRKSRIPFDFVIGIDEAGRGCLGKFVGFICMKQGPRLTGINKARLGADY